MLRQFIKRLTHPTLKRSYEAYSSKPRMYSKYGVTLRILPGVFHPGYFLSTQILRSYLSGLELEGKRVLELGAGSGFLSFYLARHQKADVTASDISEQVLKGLHANSSEFNIPIQIVKSDVLDALDATSFDYIVINPPYYPHDPSTEAEMAFYCGSDFGYFRKLFLQLSQSSFEATCLMILSQDCDLTEIQRIAESNQLSLRQVHRKRKLGEANFIYSIERL